MTKINITPTEKEIITNILKSNLEKDTLIYAFGSRVKSNSFKFSDFDLALKKSDNQKISLETFAQLKYDFEESDLIYKVDVIDLNSISKDFFNSICNDLVKIDLVI